MNRLKDIFLSGDPVNTVAFMPDYDYIFEEFVQGNLKPFYTFVFPSLLRYARKVAGEELSYLAKDCVQDAIFQCYLHRSDYKSITHWRNALFMSIRNRVIDLIRRADCDHDYIFHHTLISDDVEEDISLAIIYQDALDVIYRAVDALPEIYREIFRLSFEAGLKNAEIAEMLHVSEIAVKKRKARMIDKIRRILGHDIENYLILFILAA